MTMQSDYNRMLRESKENIKQSLEVLRSIYKEKNDARGQCNKLNKYKCKEHNEGEAYKD